MQWDGEATGRNGWKADVIGGTLLSAEERRVVGRALLALLAFSLSACATVRTEIAASPLYGTWRLQQRVDRAPDGRELVEPSLGRDPVALLIYDRGGNVSAQLMRRDRSKPTPQPTMTADPNNSAALGGYDAYFGTYLVAGNTVTHIIEAALDPKDVGRRLTRNFRIKGDTLVIFFDARGADGTPVVRTLTWKRVAR